VESNFLSRVQRKIWTTLVGEESWINRHGDFRARERYGLISRPNYVYGMLRAADVAQYFGKQHVTVVEFGVASGAGLMNMIDLAPVIENETGVKFRIVGFDTGSGLPPTDGYKDHPEIWTPGDFTTENRDKLLHELDGRAEMIWGDIHETIDSFTDTLDPSAPLGFISLDVDIYSATTAALRCLTGHAEKYSPAVSMYFDDVGFFFANRWAGELAAIAEFNDVHELRKMDRDRSLPGHRPTRTDGWYERMYVCHILDHAQRQKPRTRRELDIRSHAEFMLSRHLF